MSLILLLHKQTERVGERNIFFCPFLSLWNIERIMVNSLFLNQLLLHTHLLVYNFLFAVSLIRSSLKIFLTQTKQSNSTQAHFH